MVGLAFSIAASANFPVLFLSMFWKGLTTRGAVVGGLLVGILEAMGAGYISSAYKDAIPFVLILLILFFMPRGLFGGKSTDRV